ncbi:MAG: sugar phosphate isomerase/epimerase [Candidatus Bipolaricaulota bacterium]|nr:sugar phosphate isomerase/epimerase [Candidatus Bipolaricaulota bacterium]
MKLLASSLAFHPAPPDAALERALALGFEGVEFLCDPPWDPGAWTAGLIRRVRGFRAELSLHVPVADVNLLSPLPGARVLAEREVARTLGLAAALGARTATFHIGYKPLAGAPHDPPWDAAWEAVRRLQARAQALGVELSLENDPRHPHAYLWDLGRFREVLAGLGLSGTLDLGHAWISHGAELLRLLPPLLPHLRVVHLHGNRGEADEHLPLGAGDLPWDELLSTLRAVPLGVVEVKDPEALRASRSWIELRGWG